MKDSLLFKRHRALSASSALQVSRSFSDHQLQSPTTPLFGKFEVSLCTSKLASAQFLPCPATMTSNEQQAAGKEWQPCRRHDDAETCKKPPTYLYMLVTSGSLECFTSSNEVET